MHKPAPPCGSLRAPVHDDAGATPAPARVFALVGPHGGAAMVTVANGTQDGAAVLEVLLDANVQFVLVGEPAARGSLRLVVSRHPTNLQALGKALAQMGSTLRTIATPRPPEVPAATAGGDTAGGDKAGGDTAGGDTAGIDAAGGDTGVRRIGDPLGTVSVTAQGVDLDLLFGSPQHSLYADTLAAAATREIAGMQIRWADAPAVLPPPGRRTGRLLGRRLLSLAEGLAHIMERDGESSGTESDPTN